ncbi:MAG: hypothetical protein JXA99_03645 [Candidatus Lokiarchaeota archaeon]|nr:hypothetical protein [Candidatus Lokiarchaeota archaeon]
MINKEDLKKSLEFINDITLEEKDYDLIFKKFKKMMNDQEFENLINKKLSNQDLEKNYENLEDLLRSLIDGLDIREINIILQKIIKNEKLTTFIQDFFLERLL